MVQRYFCPVTAASKVIGKKWHPVIVDRLMEGPMRFGEIRKSIQGISAKVLSDSLSDLERKGIVDRKVQSSRPVVISYRLTVKGAELRGVMEKMSEWGTKWYRPGAATR